MKTFTTWYKVFFHCKNSLDDVHRTSRLKYGRTIIALLSFLLLSSVQTWSQSPVTIWLEDFSLPEETIVDYGSTAWSRTYTGGNSAGRAWVHSNQFACNYLGAESVWTSEVIDISSLCNVTVSIDAKGEGSLDINEDYFRAYYILDGGSEVLFINYNLDGPFDMTTSTSPTLNGNTLQIVVKEYCTGSSEIYRFDNVKVSGNEIPTAIASVSGSLSCSISSVTLLGSSNTSGVTYNWSGPDGFTSTLQNPTVSIPGTYLLTVTNSTTGCSSATSTEVTTTIGVSNVWLEDFQDLTDYVTVDNGSTAWSTDVSGMNTGYMEVRNHQFTVHGTSVDSEIGLGIWLSEVINISSYSEVNLAVDISSGGSLDAGEDYIKVFYKLNGGAETLFTNGFKDGPFTAGTVVTPSLTGNTIQIIIRTKSTGDSEYYYFDNVKVSGISEPLTASASVSGPLTCTVTSVTLFGSSNTSGVSYSWTGPGGFTSSLQNPTVSIPGTYTLTVTNPANGCTASQSATVISETTPEIVLWFEDFTLPEQTIVDNGSTAWSRTYSGTTGQSHVHLNKFVSDYLGAESVWTSEVIDISSVSDVTVSIDVLGEGSLDLNSDYFRAYYVLDGGSEVLFIDHNYDGPFDLITSTSPALNGNTLQIIVKEYCTGSTEIYRFDNVKVSGIGEPLTASASVSGPLTCTVTSVTLFGGSNTPGVSYSWTGPDSFTSDLQNPTVSNPGTYTLTVTNPENGCTASQSVTVISETSTEIVLWNEDFSLPDETIIDNGSTAWSRTYTGGNTDGRSWVQSNQFVCSYLGAESVWTSEVLDISSVSNVTIAIDAVGEGGLDANQDYFQVYYIIDGGNEVLFVNYNQGPFSLITSTSPALNGNTLQIVVKEYCTGSSEIYRFDNVQVSGITESLSATASISGPITCSNTSVTLLGNSNTTGVSYNWSGPDNFISTSQNPTTSITGTYTLTVTSPGNGCTATATTDVVSDTVAPGATAYGDTITCADTSITLQGSSPTPGVIYNWSGPDNFISTNQNPNVNIPGNYTLIVTDPDNGCTSIDIANVAADTIVPGAVAFGGTITCTDTSVILGGSSSTPEVTYSWSGPDNFISTNQNPSVSITGDYTLTVTNPANGCTSTALANVNQNTIIPDVLATGDSLPCSGSVSITGSSTVSGTIFNWTGPDDFASSDQNPTVNTTGYYILTVTDTVNGCSASDTAIVAQGETVPGVTATVSGPITCDTTSVTLFGNAGISGVIYNWSGPDNFISNLQNPTVSIPGTYTLTVTNPENGCVATAIADVATDTISPDVTAIGGIITCISDTVILNGNSLTTEVTYSWSGPNSFNSTDQNPSVSKTGIYILTVTNPANGCIATATANVAIDTTSPGAIAIGDTITCSNGSITLSGSSSTSGVTFSWSGPDSYTSNVQNPIANTAGTYILTVTDPTNGCTSTDVAEVVQDTPVPGATAGGGGTITCNEPSVIITGVSPTPGVTYDWSGPDNFISNLQNPEVTTGGLYTLTVTNPVNGCISTSTVTVLQNDTLPGAIASGGTLTCTVSSVILNASSSTSGVTYSWSGPDSFSSNLQNPSVNKEGSYILTVANPENGCVSIDTTIVEQDTIKPGATATGGSITCFTSTATLLGNSDIPGVTYSWTGPDNFTSNLQNPTVNKLGNYTLTVTNPVNGCTSTATASVTENITAPEVTASVSGPITCADTSVILYVNSGISGLSYNWTGPDGFNSNLQNPSVSTPGIYTLTVTNPVNSCSSDKTINVLEDKTEPGVIAYSDGTLTCGTNTVNLTASSATSNVTFTWGGFPAGQNPVSTGSPGNYFVTATNPVNGCKSMDSAEVNQEVSYTDYKFVYNNFYDYSSGTISDNSTNGWYLDRSQVPNVTSTYESNITPHYFAIHSHRIAAQQLGGQGIWYSNVMDVAGRPGFKIGIKITSEGSFNSDEYVKLYYKIDGGSEVLWDQRTGYFGTIDFRSPVLNANTVQIVVKLYNYGKGGSIVTNYYIEEEQLYVDECGGTLLVYPSVSGPITCVDPSATLSATASHSGATYQWSGPNGFTSSQQHPVVTEEGTYYVTATVPPSSVANGSVSVDQNKIYPDISASVSDTLTCSRTYVTLSGSSSISGATYKWTGPNSFVSSMQNPIVTDPGTYTLTVTDPDNGCSSVTSVDVAQNTIIPGATASVEDTLTCIQTSVIITGNFTTSGVIYSWSGPNEFTSTTQNPSVSVPGLYTLIVTDPTTGCTSTAFAEVIQNSEAPGASATGGSITCNNSSVELSGNSPTPGVTYSWSGPENFVSALQNPTVSLEGTYILTVTNPVNGCTSIANAIVEQSDTLPDITITGENITCTNPSVTLTGSSSVPGITYSWTGPGGFTSDLQNISVNVPGKYFLEVENTTNGCINKDSIMIDQDITEPDLSISFVDTLTCTMASVSLNASSTTPNTIFTWNGFGTGENPVEVSDPNTYIVTVIDTVSGCTKSDSVTVIQDISLPDFTIDPFGDLTCTDTAIILNARPSTPNTTISWGGFEPGENPVIVTIPGAYMVIATNSLNGCTKHDTVTVNQDISIPDLTITPVSDLTCNNTSISLSASSATPNTTFSWNGFAPGMNPVDISVPDTYIVTATDNSNGCIKQDSVTVNQDISIPDLTITPVSDLTCSDTIVSLNASSATPNTTLSWSGFALGMNPVDISVPDTYIVTATNDVNGCIKQDSVTIGQDITLPDLSLSPVGNLTCINTEVSLNAFSSTPNTIFTWNGFEPEENPVKVSVPDQYVITVTDSTNGCTKSDSVIVNQNNTAPGVMTSVNNAITCSVTSVTLSATSPTAGVKYKWAGPGGYISTQPNTVTSIPGEYTLSVTNPSNGCVSIDTIPVQLNNIKPEDVTATVQDILTCAQTFVTLSGSSGTSGVTYNWSGPNNFNSADQNPLVINAGTYSLIVTNPDNGCSSSASVLVEQDISYPSDVNATASGILTCKDTTVTLTGTSNIIDVTYTWLDPNSNNITGNPVVVSIPGTYILTVTNNSNGCNKSANVNVEQDIEAPANLTASVSDTLSCTVTSVILSAPSTTDGTTYRWEGPEGFVSNEQITVTTIPGTYSVTATDPNNGCISVQQVTVIEEICQTL